MEWVIWLVVIAVFAVRGLLKAANSGGGADRARQATRQARNELRQQASPVADWFPAPLPQPPPVAQVAAVPASVAEERFDDLREAAREAARQSARQPAQQAVEPVPSQLDVAAPAQRYVGSAALESTLDSTIESSLFGATGDPLTSSLLPGAAAPTLPAELEVQVRAFMEARHEVAAVRLVCDELNVGILEALRAVRSVAGLPSP